MSRDLPPGWVQASGSELFSFVTSGSRGWAKYVARQGAKFVRVANLGREGLRIDETDIQKVSPPPGSEGERTSIRPGDVLITITADLGRVGVAESDLGPAYVNQHVALARPHTPEISKYIGYFVQSPIGQEQLGLANRGATRAGLGLEDIRSIRVPLPPLPEQRRIVDRIEALTARATRAREALDAIPALLDRYRQSLLAAAFRGELTAEWRGGTDTSDWQDVTFADLLSGKAGNGLSVRGSDVPPGIPALKLSAIRSGRIDYTEVRYLPIPRERAERLFIAAGDFLVSRGNGSKHLVARCAVADEPPGDVIYPDTMIRFRLDASRVDLAWLRHLWEAPQVRAEIERRAKTTAGIWKVSQADLGQIPLRLPGLAEQAEIARRVNAALEAIASLEAAHSAVADRHTTLTQSILAKAFRGALVPPDPADEPASVLLERIRAERAAGGGEKPRRRRRAPVDA